MDPVVFNQIELNDTILNNSEQVVRIFGRTDDGKSVLCTVHGYFPYLITRVPAKLKLNLKENLSELEQKLNRLTSNQIIKCEYEENKCIYGYNLKTEFVKITYAMSTVGGQIKKALKEGTKLLLKKGIELFECFLCTNNRHCSK